MESYNYKKINNDNVVKITGNVSTKNNGGFIQVRRNFKSICGIFYEIVIFNLIMKNILSTCRKNFTGLSSSQSN